MTKRTKVVATLGPASSDVKTIQKMIEAGASVFRLNFSHGDVAQHREVVNNVRKAAEKAGQFVALMGDLQGPKIRISDFVENSVKLKPGNKFVLDSELGSKEGDENQVGISYPLAQDCRTGQTLLLDDGRIELEIVDVAGKKVITEVVVGGQLSAKKGINLRGGGLSAESLTEEDKANIELAGELDLDYLAISFPRSASDMHTARQLCSEQDYYPRLISKIERAEAVLTDDILGSIIETSDAVMVARGDLGVEIGDAQLVGIQKKIIAMASGYNKAVIIATQMMETMIENTLPTRAEVFDVANAVLDGTDAVMLSAETAVGKHPVLVVESMTRIIAGAEDQDAAKISRHRIDEMFMYVDESIAMATMYVANHLNDIDAILCFTESGNTPVWMSRIRSGIPIYALSRNDKSLNRLALYRGVTPFHFDLDNLNAEIVLKNAITNLKKEGVIRTGNKIIATYGDKVGEGGHTNVMTIKQVS